MVCSVILTEQIWRALSFGCADTVVGEEISVQWCPDLDLAALCGGNTDLPGKWHVGLATQAPPALPRRIFCGDQLGESGRQIGAGVACSIGQ
jgi:hypothetical protein